MRLISSDPDLSTLIERMRKNEINLQPDFQRGEVWGIGKKRRLIDTILRQWHVPPVHLIANTEDDIEEVLDGQQRLTAIRDFAEGAIAVDGTLEPADSKIAALDGLTYADLPDTVRRRFERYSLRVLTATDYSPEEPGELFFRLNQPTNLTAAEQRNAFYGEARAQVKRVVRKFELWGLSRDVLGFSNSRMAYDDIVARVCFTIENKRLHDKVTAAGVTARYRTTKAFGRTTMKRCSLALELFGSALRLTKNRASGFRVGLSQSRV
jgi:hypothetical protein